MMNPKDGRIDSYDDMMDMPHHTSAVHPHMSVYDRAAQFAPFAALTGHDTAIRETARLTESRVELDEYSKADLNRRLCILQDRIDEKPEVSITYFQPDTKKSGGQYMTASGCIKKMEEYERAVIMEDDTRIPMDQIFAVDGEWFGSIEGGNELYGGL